MQVADYIDSVASEGDRFATAAEKGELSVDIPGCEGWDRARSRPPCSG